MSELPDSWFETKLGEVIDYGATVKVEPGDIPDDAWILELEDIEKDSSNIVSRFTFADRRSKSTKNRFAKGDVLYGKLRPYLNKVVLADADGYCTTEIIPIKPTAATNNRFVFHWLKHPSFVGYATEVSHGLNMPRLGTDAGKNAPFVLAPLAEQERIADKLDALLARVDACRERLDRVPSILKRFRQSVLAAATSGALTHEWRDERGRSTEEWNRVRVKDIVTIKNGRAFPSSDYGLEGVRLLRPGNLHASGRVEWDGSNTRRLPIRYVKEFPGFLLGQGELLMNLTAQSLKDEFLGRACLKRDSEPALLNQRICAFYPSVEWDVRPYLFLYFRSPVFRKYVDTLDSGTLIKHMHSKQLLEHELSLPPKDEGEEICRRTESLLAAGEQVERKLATLVDQLSALPDALVAKAFRGELVPQDPNDEPASKLLARLRAHPASVATTEKPKRGGTRGSRTKAMADTNMLTRKDVTPTHLTNILKDRGSLTAEVLWGASQLEIDDFYDQLKDEEARGLLRENRGNTPNAPRLLESAE